jgi:hypothetical protein
MTINPDFSAPSARHRAVLEGLENKVRTGLDPQIGLT